MKTVTYDNNGRRLILKNPPNSTRIKQLLDIFPDAKFIHILRDGRTVVNSLINRDFYGD